MRKMITEKYRVKCSTTIVEPKMESEREREQSKGCFHGALQLVTRALCFSLCSHDLRTGQIQPGHHGRHCHADRYVHTTLTYTNDHVSAAFVYWLMPFVQSGEKYRIISEAASTRFYLAHDVSRQLFDKPEKEYKKWQMV